MGHHILFTGGGTLGPVTPLLAVATQWRKRDPDAKFSWIGTHGGPERVLVESAKIPFTPLAAPKFNRHQPWKLPFLPFFFIASFIKAWKLLKEMEPDLIMTAGAYVSVPLAVAGWMRGIPLWVHQLDVLPVVSNKIMAPIAKKISVTWSETAERFPKRKTEVVGGMVRSMITMGDRDAARDRYGLREDLPTVLVIGGGTGASSLNDAMSIIADDLMKKANVIHLTGRGKMLASLQNYHNEGKNYIALEFLNEGMADAYALADVVVARAGFGTICEIAALGKPTVLVPMQSPFQLTNADELAKRNAAEVITALTPQVLLQAINRILDRPAHRDELAQNVRTLFPLNADERIVHGALELLSQKT